MDLKSHIRSIPDWPKDGVVFRDITTLLQDPDALQAAVNALVEQIGDTDIDLVVAPEARGFILGGAVACRLGAGFVPVRKPGKLPAEIAQKAYDLEYGSNTVAIHRDAVRPGQRVLLLDDLLATGGTARACCELVEELGGRVVGCVFLIELSFLPGRQTLEGYPVSAVIDYTSE